MLDILTVEKSKKELTQKSLEVSEEEISDLQSLIDNMLSMVNDIGCIGITAPQVGVFKRIFVLYNGNVYINPIVILSSKKIMSIGEGCLSIPGKFYKVSNGRDADFFKPDSESRLRIRREFGLSDNDLLWVYSGSIGPQYMVEEMLDLFGSHHRENPGSKFLILTRDAAFGKKFDKSVFPGTQGGPLEH
jgi:hypothetical protein